MIEASQRRFWVTWEAPILPFCKVNPTVGLLKPPAPHFAEKEEAEEP